MTEKYFPNKRAIFIWTLVCEESGRGSGPTLRCCDELECSYPRLLSNNTVRKWVRERNYKSTWCTCTGRFSLLYGDGVPAKPLRQRLYRSYNKNIRQPSLHHEYLRERERCYSKRIFKTSLNVGTRTSAASRVIPDCEEHRVRDKTAVNRPVRENMKLSGQCALK